MSLYFGLTPEQFGENLRDNYQRHETEQHTNSKKIIARQERSLSHGFNPSSDNSNQSQKGRIINFFEIFLNRQD